MALLMSRMLQRGSCMLVGAPAARMLPRFPIMLASTRLLARTAAKAPLAAEPADELQMEEDWVTAQPASVQRRVLKLKEVQEAYDTIGRDFQKELAILQAKYQEKYQPLLDERSQVVAGSIKVPAYDVRDDEGEAEPDQGIKEFWLTAFYNHEKVGPYITERDAEVLKFLTDVRSAVLTGEDRGFDLIFTFAPNKFFSNQTLTKRYILEPEDDIIPKEFVGCEISWLDPAVNPTIEQKKRRVKNKEAGKGGKPAFVVESVPIESFFNIFAPPKIPDNPEQLEDEELDALQEELTADFDIGYAIKDQIIPRAVEWYTGELSQFDEGDFNEDEYDENE